MCLDTSLMSYVHVENSYWSLSRELTERVSHIQQLSLKKFTEVIYLKNEKKKTKQKPPNKLIVF